MENKPALTSEQRLAYIGDMADIETREFMMRKAVQELEEENRFRESYLSSITPRRRDCSKYKTARDHYLQVYQDHRLTIEEPKEPQKPDGYDEFKKKYQSEIPENKYITIGGIIGRIILFPLVSALLILVNSLLFGVGVGLFKWDSSIQPSILFDTFYICLALFGSLLIVFLPYVLGILWHHKFKKAWNIYHPYEVAHAQYLADNNQYQKLKVIDIKHREAYENAEKAYKEQCEKAENEYCEQCLQYNSDSLKLSFLIEANNAQIALLKNSIQTLCEKKEDLYSIGIIPPDYRQMDCVIMLHQIFRNGLKDNMADAILLYEERVFRQEIIRGIDKIYKMLGQLKDSMRAIESRLMEVKQELQMIGSDMSNQLAAIADNQSRLLSEMEDASEAQASYAAAQEQWQREQLAETRASRYAAEAVQRSNERYEWYMEQHRQGLM